MTLYIYVILNIEKETHGFENFIVQRKHLEFIDFILISIVYVYKPHRRSVRLLVSTKLCRLKSERHETQHLGVSSP